MNTHSSTATTKEMVTQARAVLAAHLGDLGLGVHPLAKARREKIVAAMLAFAARPDDIAGVPDGLIERIERWQRGTGESTDKLLRDCLAALSARPSPPKVDATACPECGDTSPLDECGTCGAYPQRASPTRGAEDTQAEVVRLPRLTRSMIRAACKAHYASDNIYGINLTANAREWSFEQAFRRMWSGVRAALQGEGSTS